MWENTDNIGTCHTHKSQMMIFGLLISFSFFCPSLLGSVTRPPQFPPPSTIQSYSMNGIIPIEYFYVDDTNNGSSWHYIYTSTQIDDMKDRAKKFYSKIESAVLGASSQGLPADVILRQLRKEDWIYYALLNHTSSVINARVGVIGSSSPWVEALLLSIGAAEVVTIEYNKLTYGDEKTRITTISGEQLNLFYSTSQGTFDALFSLSSFEHDGLGRYGDPLNPDADLLAVRKARSLLKPTGILFLSMPIGPDVVVFNLHRRYGRIRLPHILHGWEVVDRVGWDESRLEAQANWRQTYEPIFILKRNASTEDEEDLDGGMRSNSEVESVDRNEL
jgi:SAM-dependent methyltransferase